MKALIKRHWLILVIIALAAWLRLAGLGQMPASLNLDEVAIGYNAFSILQTGQDEFGNRFPLAFRSHDDYKAPLYIYLTTIPISLLGLNPVAVRLISALSGIVTVLFVYLLARNWLGAVPSRYQYLPELWSALLAISPWHLQFSRAAFETNLGLMLVCLGLWLFYLGKNYTQNNKGWINRYTLWFLSIFSFGLSLYAYHSTKLFVPLLGIFLIYQYRKAVFADKFKSLVLAVISILLIVPVVWQSSTNNGQLRFEGTSVFNTPTLIDENREYRTEFMVSGKPWAARLYHHPLIIAPQVILKGYLSHFEYHFLFYGDVGPPKNYTPNVGLFYWWQLPLMIAGAYWLVADKKLKPSLICLWILLTPIASALTWDAPSATRTTLMVPPLLFLVAIGIVQTSHKLKPLFRPLGLAVLLVIAGHGLGMYWHNYWHVAPVKHAEAWQYGYAQAVASVESRTSPDDQVIVSTDLKQPQNFFAFYSQYDPTTYINIDGGTVSGGFDETENKFGRYQFKPISWKNSDLESGTVYVDLVSDDNRSFQAEELIYLPNGEPYIMIYYHQL